MNIISQLRKKAHISQKELGKIVGVAQNTICNWEKGNREPDNETLKRLADLFGVSVDYLLGRDSYISNQAPIPEYDNILKNESPIQDAYNNASPAIQEAVRKLLDIE